MSPNFELIQKAFPQQFDVATNCVQSLTDSWHSGINAFKTGFLRP